MPADPIPARRYDFAIRNDDGTTKPAALLLPTDLTWEEAHAVQGAVIQITGQVVTEAEHRKNGGLVLVKGSLLPEGA